VLLLQFESKKKGKGLGEDQTHIYLVGVPTAPRERLHGHLRAWPTKASPSSPPNPHRMRRGSWSAFESSGAGAGWAARCDGVATASVDGLLPTMVITAQVRDESYWRSGGGGQGGGWQQGRSDGRMKTKQGHKLLRRAIGTLCITCWQLLLQMLRSSDTATKRGHRKMVD
jgi:hypothetical protein